MPLAAADGGQALRVQQLLRQLAPDYRQRFGAAMPGRHRQVLRNILSCRTPALGGQLFQCPGCSDLVYRYHSCNDRHCPQCGQTDADDWLQRQRARLLLPVPYFLVTFTVPEEIRLFIRSNQKLALDLFFAVTSQALQDLAGNPRLLGAHLGMLGVLHTWSRTLVYHPHIHYLVPGGGLSADGRTWVPARPNFLLPVKALGAHVRTLFRDRLQREHPELFALVPAKVWRRHWNVDSRAAGSGENALRYLSRYVFKTATSNRIVHRLPDGRVLWPYRDSQTGQPATITLAPLDWMSRFLQHILPPHFARVRTFGWLHPAAKVRANRVRALLRANPLLTPAEQRVWWPPDDAGMAPDQTPLPGPAATLDPLVPAPTTTTDKSCSTPSCPRCQRAMRLVGSFRPGQPFLHHLLPLPNRPP
jgi:Putative transposase/Transposase zinc-binding domain